jgi:hypothetical protein
MSGDWLDLLGAVGKVLVTPSTESRLDTLERGQARKASDDRPWASAFDPPEPENMSRPVTHAEHRALTKQVAQLQVMVTVLAEALAEKGAIDGLWAGARLRERLAALEPKKPEPKKQKKKAGGVETYRGAGPDPEPTTACAKCQKQVPTRATRLTGQGTVCDGCYEE